MSSIQSSDNAIAWNGQSVQRDGHQAGGEKLNSARMAQKRASGSAPSPNWAAKAEKILHNTNIGDNYGKILIPKYCFPTAKREWTSIPETKVLVCCVLRG
jgi:hypothetical protein